VGEVRELEYAKDQRETNGAQREDGSEHDANCQRVTLGKRGPDREDDDRRPEAATAGDVAGRTLESAQAVPEIH